MRRASKPAICLNVTSTPSPRTVTMFCSLRSADAGFIGVQILALLVVHARQHARNRRPVHMHIEHAQKNADSLPRSLRVAIVTVSVTSPSPGDTISPGPSAQPVEGREKTTEKTPPTAPAQSPRPNCPSPTPALRHCQQAQTVDITVAYHRPQRLYGDCVPVSGRTITGRTAVKLSLGESFRIDLRA